MCFHSQYSYLENFKWRPDHDQQEGRQQQPDDPDPRKTFPLKSIKDILQLKIIN